MTAPDLGRCTEPGCAIRYRSGGDRPCRWHSDERGAIFYNPAASDGSDCHPEPQPNESVHEILARARAERASRGRRLAAEQLGDNDTQGEPWNAAT